MLYKRGNIWWVKFRHNGESIRASTGERARQKAAKKARQIQAAHEKDAGPKGRQSLLTVGDLETLDLERSASSGHGPRRAHTIEGLWSPVFDFFGRHAPIESIELPHLTDYEAWRRRDDIRGQTIRREMQALRRGLKLAEIRFGVTQPIDWSHAPVVRSDPPKVEQASKPWSAADISKIFDNLSPKAVTMGVRDSMRFVQLTGLRIDELRRVLPSWRRGNRLEVPAVSTKGRRARVVPLGPEAVEIWDRWQGYLPVGKPNKALKLASERAGFDRVLTPRDLRAWFITQAARVDLVAAQRLAGHSSIATTSKYLHSSEETETEAALAAQEAAL